MRAENSPWTGCQSIAGHTHSLWWAVLSLQSVLFLNWGRKAQCTEKTHAHKTEMSTHTMSPANECISQKHSAIHSMQQLTKHKLALITWRQINDWAWIQKTIPANGQSNCFQEVKLPVIKGEMNHIRDILHRVVITSQHSHVGPRWALCCSLGITHHSYPNETLAPWSYYSLWAVFFFLFSQSSYQKSINMFYSTFLITKTAPVNAQEAG